MSDAACHFPLSELTEVGERILELVDQLDKVSVHVCESLEVVKFLCCRDNGNKMGRFMKDRTGEASVVAERT